MDDLLTQYAGGPRQLRAALADCTEADLDRAPAEGGWTIRQIAHHIVDGDDLWKWGIKAALGNAQGIFTLQWYQDIAQIVWADRWQYARRDLAPALTLLETNRAIIVELLRATPDALGKHMIVRWRGKDGNYKEEVTTIRQIVESQTRHVFGHIAAIRQINQGRE